MTAPTAVLVTDAPSNANLAVVRSLGRRGIPVGVCGFPGEFNLAFHSRYARERFTLPSPALDPSGFIDALGRVLASGGYPILFPTSERTIQLVSERREALPAWVRVPIPDRDALAIALDKEQTTRVAQSLGVPVPATWCPAGPEDLAALLAELPYPVMIKPRQTNHLGTDGQLRKAGYVVARSAAEAERGYREIHARVPRPLLQEMLRGTGSGMFSIWDAGTPLAWFAHRRLREEDPRGGRASAAVSIAGDPRLAECATRLLKALGWHGVAMVEFKWDMDRDAFWLMEINGRFWGSLGLALTAGMDFPYYLYRLARGEAVEAPAQYALGVVGRDPVAELKHFLRVLRGRPHGFTGSFPSRIGTLTRMGEVLHPWRHSFNWTADDPEPGRREWARLLGRIVGRR